MVMNFFPAVCLPLEGYYSKKGYLLISKTSHTHTQMDSDDHLNFGLIWTLSIQVRSFIPKYFCPEFLNIEKFTINDRLEWDCRSWISIEDQNGNAKRKKKIKHFCSYSRNYRWRKSNTKLVMHYFMYKSFGTILCSLFTFQRFEYECKKRHEFHSNMCKNFSNELTRFHDLICFEQRTQTVPRDLGWPIPRI